MLSDPRDEVFVRLTLRVLVTQPIAMGLLYAGLHYTQLPTLLVALAYLAFWGWSTPPIILMLHCTMHRKFIVRPKFLDWLHPYAMAFLFGMPMGFREHHIGMHHVEDNMGHDLSSTLRYRRDSFLHFLLYFGRFFVFVPFDLPRYLARNRRTGMARRAVIGEIAQWAIIATVIVAVDWRFGVIAFLLPCVLCRFMMMAGNWGQHAFLNTAHPNNGLSNSITCINSTYNKRCWNDGYHIGHHLRAKRHWAELPGDFLANRETYARQGAIVFEKLDFFMVSLLLWLGWWNMLAKHVVRLDGPRSDAEIVAMLKSRVHPVVEWPGAEPERAPRGVMAPELTSAGAGADHGARQRPSPGARAGATGEPISSRVPAAGPAVEASSSGIAAAFAPDESSKRPKEAFGLSRREREVLALIAEGRTNREIGERLFISQKTVGVHVGNILSKLGASGRVEAAMVAIRLELVPTPLAARPALAAG